MLSIGLTGGIASGKTTISRLFSDRGVPVVDTDVISRQILEPGEDAFKQVVSHFGDEIMADSDHIDRVKLRKKVFSSKTDKRWLEATLHPLIYHRSHEEIKQYKSAHYVLVVVPLLFETNFQSLVDRVLAVDCSREIQIERLLKRDNIDLDLAEKMLAQQMSNEVRLSRAHDSIDNQQDIAALEAQVDRLHLTYQALGRE